MSNDNLTDIKPASNVISLVERFSVVKCGHHQIIVDEVLATVECKSCGEKLNPVVILARMAREGSALHYERNELRKLEARLDKRKRCQCKHCGRMTPI